LVPHCSAESLAPVPVPLTTADIEHQPFANNWSYDRRLHALATGYSTPHMLTLRSTFITASANRTMSGRSPLNFPALFIINRIIHYHFYRWKKSV